MRSRALKGVMLTSLVVSLTGCGDLPVVGNLGATLSAVAAPVMGLLDPVIGQFIPKAEPTPPPPRPRPRPRRRAVAAANNPAVTTPGATDSAVVAAAQNPQAAFAAWAERNRRFDKLRTDGLMQLYNGQTAGAIQSFKEAQALRPHDPSIVSLVALASNPSAFKSDGGGVSAAGAPPSLPQPEAPGLPAGAAGVVNQLLNGGQSAGDTPGGLF